MASFSVQTLFSCFLIHIQLLNGNSWFVFASEGYIPLTLSLFQGTSYLLYPLYGWIADVFFTNFKVIKWSFILMLASSISMLMSGLWLIIGSQYEKNTFVYTTLFFTVVIITGLIGSGMYESNAIQFGMDQMLESSSEQLSSFIHWYFWCASVGIPIIYYILVAANLYFRDCVVEMHKIKHSFDNFIGSILLLLSGVQLLFSLCGIFFSFLSTRCFTIEQISKNPLKTIFEVLMYSYKQKYPERRSAFTYWENDIPSRIDLGKEKYGGPFTYEQVEDVKTMLRLLLLMVSLFGYHLSGDGYSLSYYIMSTSGCPTLVPLSALIANPQHIGILVVVIGIPMYRLFNRYISHCTPSLLNRLWLGLFICLFNECLQCNYSLLLQRREFNCLEMGLYISEKPSLLLQCIAAHLKVVENSTCQHICSTLPVNDFIIYLSFVPLIMNGLSYLLVFVTTVEFICAQSPNAMKGFLIGVWYSMLFIRYSVVNNLDVHPFLLKLGKWNIYHGIKGVLIFLSLVSFSIVYKHYQFRRRDDIVNEQAMIEEQYERELLLNSSNNISEHSCD